MRRRAIHEPIGGWLLLAMTLWVSSQLHNLFWPSGYVPILTTASVFRLGFAAVIAVSERIGWRETSNAFRRLAEDRAALLAVERDAVQRLSELNTLRNDFTSMIAHELGNPIAAIRRQTELLAWQSDHDAPEFTAYNSILAETELLTTLIRDVQDISAIERADFAVSLSTIPVGVLIADAATFAEALPERTRSNRRHSKYVCVPIPIASEVARDWL